MRYALLGMLMFLLGAIPAASDRQADALFREARFDAVVAMLQSTAEAPLDRHSELLFLESMARLGRAFEIRPRILELLSGEPPAADLYATASAVFLAAGDIQAAEHFITLAQALDPDHHGALLNRTLLLIEQQHHAAAEATWAKVRRLYPALAQSRLGILVSRRLYQSSRNPDALRALRPEKNIGPDVPTQGGPDTGIDSIYEDLPADTWFAVDTTGERVSVPLVNFGDTFYKCLIYEHQEKHYRILLDTGNAPGWTLHEPALQSVLVSRRGGGSRISTGSVDHELDSYHLRTDLLDFGSFTVQHLTGSFFAKPRENYFDGNLNPFFIRNRVVSMDFVHNRLLLRTAEAFREDRQSWPAGTYGEVAVYGHCWPFIPITVNGYAHGLAMLETGAEDISVKLEFARSIHLPLQEAVKEWRGQSYNYHQTDLTVMVDTLVFHRPASEVWPVRFHDPLTGMADHVMIGPWALEGKYILTFDPFQRKVYLQTAPSSVDAP